MLASMPGRNARVGYVRYETAAANKLPPRLCGGSRPHMAAKLNACPFLFLIYVVAYLDRVNVSRRRRTEPAPPDRSKRNEPVLE